MHLCCLHRLEIGGISSNRPREKTPYEKTPTKRLHSFAFRSVVTNHKQAEERNITRSSPVQMLSYLRLVNGHSRDKVLIIQCP